MTGNAVPREMTDRTMHMTWSEVAAAYFAARAAEDAYDYEFCCIDHTLPVGPERSAAIDAIPPEHMEEAERLQNVRCDIEKRLLEMPAPNAASFALKVMICRGAGRDLDGYDDLLEAEARQIVMADLAARSLIRAEGVPS